MPGLYGSATYASHAARAFIVRGIGVHASLTRGSRPPIRSRRSRLGGLVGAGSPVLPARNRHPPPPTFRTSAPTTLHGVPMA